MKHPRLTQAFAALEQALADASAPSWPDQRAPAVDPLNQLDHALGMFVAADSAKVTRHLRDRALAAVLEEAHAAHRVMSERDDPEALNAAGERIADSFRDAFNELTTASAYQQLLDALLGVAALTTGAPVGERWFALPKLPLDHPCLRSLPTLLRIIERLIDAWVEWDELVLDTDSIAVALRACLTTDLLEDYQDPDDERWLWLVALGSTIDNLLDGRWLDWLHIGRHEAAVGVVDSIHARLEALGVEAPADVDSSDGNEAWELLWSSARCSRTTELVRDVYNQYNDFAAGRTSQSYSFIIESPGSYTPELLVEHLLDWYAWDNDLRDRDSPEVGLLGEFPDAIELERSAAHFATGTKLAAEALRILERYHEQLEPLLRRLESHPITTSLVELQALAELLANQPPWPVLCRELMHGSLRGIVGGLIVLGMLGCRVPATIESPPPRTVQVEQPQGESGEPNDEEDDDEHEAPDELPPSPNPAPPSKQPDTRIGLGLPNDERPAGVGVTTLSVEPDEFRSSLSPHDKSGDQLLACVRSRFADDTAIHGSMVIDYEIGSGARVTAVTVRACEFPDEAICDCIGEVVAKWRFRPNVQLVDVAIRVHAQPRRRHQ